jgi:hypothetical protein
MQLYKVLEKDMSSPFKSFVFVPGKEYICEDFDENHKNDCSRGFYATDIDGLPYSYNIHRDVWTCEVGGSSVEINEFKRRYEKIVLLEKVDKESLRKLALAWDSKVGYKLSEVLSPINPLLVARPVGVSDDEKTLLENWQAVWYLAGLSVIDSVRQSVRQSVGDSVGQSVGDSVWQSVGQSVGDSVWQSVIDSVWHSVWLSVRDSAGQSVGHSVGQSVWAYMGSIFHNIKQWRYASSKSGEYPYQAGVDLWQAGLVASFDGGTWRLHTGDKADIIYETKI